jgi:hypothetical protein
MSYLSIYDPCLLYCEPSELLDASASPETPDVQAQPPSAADCVREDALRPFTFLSSKWSAVHAANSPPTSQSGPEGSENCPISPRVTLGVISRTDLFRSRHFVPTTMPGTHLGRADTAAPAAPTSIDGWSPPYHEHPTALTVRSLAVAGHHHPGGGSRRKSLAHVLRGTHCAANSMKAAGIADRAEARILRPRRLLAMRATYLHGAQHRKCWSSGPCLISRARVVARMRPKSAGIARLVDPLRPPPYPAHSAALTVHPLAPPERATSRPSERRFALREQHTTLTPGRVSYADLLTRVPGGQSPPLPHCPRANTLRKISTPGY